MDQIPAAMDRHLEVVHCHKGMGFLLFIFSSIHHNSQFPTHEQGVDRVNKQTMLFLASL